MKDWQKKLAAKFLRDYADQLGNNGCNDYEAPEYVPVDELERLCGEANRDPDEPVMEDPPDFAVAEMLAYLIERDSEVS